VTDPDDRLDEVADAILDGGQIDWPAVESTGVAHDRGLISPLKVLAALADLHRRLPAPAARTTGHELHQPEHWGQLRVLERIGHGSFGEVFRAWDTRLDREVALKLLPASSPTDTGRATSIIDEGRRLARVRHPNVVTIYGADALDDRIGLWMELVRGRTLEQVLTDGRTFGVAEVLAIGVQVSRAVAAVHDAGLLHRDIKAHNVMLAEDGRVVLMDFGTGQDLDKQSGFGLAGTPLYLAPEILNGGTANVQSDIYSVGVLLYHLFTRSYPVVAGDLSALRAAHARGERTEMRSLRPDVPPRLARLVERAIDPDSVQRYRSANALEAALASISERRFPIGLASTLSVVAVLALATWLTWGATRGAAVDAGRSAAGVAAVSPAARPIIAVLPLQNLSTEPGGEYFADGLTDEIIRNLAVIDGLDVRSRTSSFYFKGRPRNLRDVAEQLDASLVLEGSVLRAGQQLRINVQLVQVAGDVTVWSERFDRELRDVFAIQDEISRAIVNKLRLSLGRGQRRYDTDLATYDLYLRARALADRRGAASTRLAADLLDQVIERDPTFAPAYAGMAFAYAHMAWGYDGIDFEAAHAVTRPAAVKALQLDPLLAEAHAAMGIVHARERDWATAEQSFQRAIELDPSLTQAYTNYAFTTLRPLDKREQAEEILRAAQRIDPLSLDVQREIGNMQVDFGRYGEAVATFRRILALDPEFPFVRPVHLPRALMWAGQVEEAIRLMEDPRAAGSPAYLAHAYILAGRRADAERLAAANKGFPYREVMIHAALGNLDRAFAALDEVSAHEPHRVGLLLVRPETVALRADARLTEFRRKFGLPD
jgi:serine/threonine-protein kinase